MLDDLLSNELETIYGNKKEKNDKKDKKRTFTADQKLSAFMIQNGKCAGEGCRKKLDRNTMTAHHRKMHANNGKTTTENCMLLCADCHAKIHKTEKGKVKKNSKSKTIDWLKME